MTPEKVCSELVPIQRELSVIAERLRVKLAQDQVYIAIEEPKSRSLLEWAKVIGAVIAWGAAALGVYAGIGYIGYLAWSWLLGVKR